MAPQYGDERLINVAGFLTGKAWPNLGIPYSLQIDNAFCLPISKAKLNPWNVFVLTYLFFAVEVVVSPLTSWAGLNMSKASTICGRAGPSAATVIKPSPRCRLPPTGSVATTTTIGLIRVCEPPPTAPASPPSSSRPAGAASGFPPDGFSVSDYQDA
jgi:hypothetical protein